MKKHQRALSEKLDRLSQRLDFDISDEELTDQENAQATLELAAISTRLAAAIPSATFSPEERVERLARVVDHTTPKAEFMEPNSKKLARIKLRVDELMPGTELSTEQKIDKLGEMFRAVFPDKLRDSA